MTGPFEGKIRQFIDESLEDADIITAEVVQEVYYRIVGRSPVDTGFFRANWGYQVGSPANVRVLNTGKSGAPMAPPGGLEVSLPALGQLHYISNGLPYAWALERGSSDQAPQGMVELTAIEFGSIVAEVVAARPKT